jgi:chemotaxis protein histidine kinase CheA
LSLNNLHDGIASLHPKLIKFRKRASEKDPITGNPRYGENTLKRVNQLLNLFDTLEKAVLNSFGEHWLQEDANSADLIARLRAHAEREDEELRRARLEAIEQEKRATAEQEAQQAREEEQKQREMEEARLACLREEAELAERAQQIRRARQQAAEAERRAQEAAENADRQWAASIQKGLDGVREQLKILRDAIGSDASAFSTALNALYTLFSQITAHPEDTNFRRVRRDHPRFHQDIGRHPGGREILIAAGFELGAIDGVACFISKEPDIEKDMDGWSRWFDLLKSTLAIIEEELIK